MTKCQIPPALGRCGKGSRFYVFGGVEDDSVEEDQWGEEGTHAVQDGDFALFLDAGGFAVHGHPAAAVGRNVLGILAVGGEVPIDQSVEDEPAEEREDALAQAHGNGDGCSHRAHPHEQIEDVLYHDCELAVRVPNHAMRMADRLNCGFIQADSPDSFI
jgi:hypothetical protein